LPWLSAQYFGGSYLPSVSDATLNALSEAAAKGRELQEVQDMYEQSLKELETDLNDTKAEANELKVEWVSANGGLKLSRNHPGLFNSVQQLFLSTSAVRVVCVKILESWQLITVVSSVNKNNNNTITDIKFSPHVFRSFHQGLKEYWKALTMISHL
jgi:hypothetical protein